MIEVLLPHRTHSKGAVRQAVEQGLSLGAIGPGVVTLFARHLAELPEGRPYQPSLLDVGELSRYDRPLPQTGAYDALLAGRGR